MAPPLGAVLLLGQPGAGKSLLGNALARAHASAVLNVGEELRAAGLVQQALEHPTEAGRAEMAAEARRLIEERCRKLRADASQEGELGTRRWVERRNRHRSSWRCPAAHYPLPTTPWLSGCCRVLLLECVKDLDGAYMLMEVLQEQQVPLLQVGRHRSSRVEQLLGHSLPLPMPATTWQSMPCRCSTSPKRA
jgi:hypothetical protein